MNLVDQIVVLHRRLEHVEIPHAFGGAGALAWCTERARATIDIDVNLFMSKDAADDVFAALPEAVVVTPDDRLAIECDGQTRLWWGPTPVDVFFNTTSFHSDIATRGRSEHFGGEEVPFLACRDLAVFKAFFARTKDWADLEEVAAADSLDVEAVLGVLSQYLGVDDHRIDRLRRISDTIDPAPNKPRTG